MRLLFTRNESTAFQYILNNTICVATRSSYSHGELLFSDNTCITAFPFRGVVRRKFDVAVKNVRKNQFAIYNVYVTKAQERVIREFADAQVGKPYDWSALLALPFRANWADTEKWFCFELCAAAFQHAGISIVDEKPKRVLATHLIESPLLVKS